MRKLASLLYFLLVCSAMAQVTPTSLLPPATNITAGNLIPIVDLPNQKGGTKKATISQLAGALSAASINFVGTVVTISPIGIVTGDTLIPNNGAMFGPDSRKADGSLTSTSGLQEGLNALKVVNGVTSAIAGGGKLQLWQGTFNVSTQVFLPGLFNKPSFLVIEGSGMNNTVFKYNGRTNDPAITTAFQGAPDFTTNYLSLVVRDMAFLYVTNTTQKILDIHNHAWSIWHNCLFAYAGSVSNEYGGITLCTENTQPQVVPGLVGLYLSQTTSSQQDVIDHCYFMGLACGAYLGGKSEVAHSYFMSCGTLSTNTVGNANFNVRTSAWHTVTATVDDLLTVGCALIHACPDEGPRVHDNFFYNCGVAMGVWNVDDTGSENALWDLNNYSLTHFRLASVDDGILWSAFERQNTNDTVHYAPDSRLTNGSSWLAPSRVPLTNVVEFRFGTVGNQIKRFSLLNGDTHMQNPTIHFLRTNEFRWQFDQTNRYARWIYDENSTNQYGHLVFNFSIDNTGDNESTYLELFPASFAYPWVFDAGASFPKVRISDGAGTEGYLLVENYVSAGDRVFAGSSVIFNTNATTVKAIGSLHTDITQVGNIGGGEDPLMVYSMPGGTLANNGDFLEIDGFGTLAPSAQANFYFGGTVYNFSNGGGIAHGWHIHVVIARKDATHQVGTIFYMLDGLAFQDVAFTPAETLSGAVTIKFTGQSSGTTDNDAVQKFFGIKYNPAN